MVGMRSPAIHLALGQARQLSRLAWQGFHQVLWPPVCLCCGGQAGPDNSGLCSGCWDQLLTSTAGEYCPRCGRDASRYGLVHGACPACAAEDIHFDGIARAGIYTETLRRMILMFKHDRTEFETLLGSLADAAFQGSPFYEQIELLVPVPLHWTRRLARGYNQSRRIAGRLRHPTARICPDLVRVRRTRAQPAAATAAARQRNVQGAFAVRPDHRYAGKTICLVDDIKTTGATLNECARTLKEAGAVRVYALVLAVAGQDLG
jgi:ComF family protein